jgi:hypothetical protein
LTADPSDGSAKATEGVAFRVMVITFDAIAKVPCTVAKLRFGGIMGIPRVIPLGEAAITGTARATSKTATKTEKIPINTDLRNNLCIILLPQVFVFKVIYSIKRKTLIFVTICFIHFP